MAAIAHLDIGDRWTPQATFTVGGVNTDPTNLTVVQQAPDGTETVLANSVLVSGLTGASTPVAKTATGIFKLNPGVSLTTSGHWYVRFAGTGAAEAAETHEAIVDPDAFTDDWGLSDSALVGLGEAKDFLARRQVDTTNDLQLVSKINAASERIAQTAGREFKAYGTNPDARLYDVRGSGYIVQIGDLQTVSTASTTISVSQLDPLTPLHTFASTDFEALPRNRKPWQPITAIRFNRPTRGYYRSSNIIEIDGYWGFPQVPEDIKHATMQAVGYWLDIDVEHFRQDLAAVPGGSEGGQTVFVGQTAPTIYPLPPDAYQIAVNYRRRLIG